MKQCIEHAIFPLFRCRKKRSRLLMRTGPNVMRNEWKFIYEIRAAGGHFSIHFFSLNNWVRLIRLQSRN